MEKVVVVEAVAQDATAFVPVATVKCPLASAASVVLEIRDEEAQFASTATVVGAPPSSSKSMILTEVQQWNVLKAMLKVRVVKTSI